MVFTKTDKLSAVKLKTALQEYEKVMLEEWEEMPMYFITSAVKNIGTQELLNFIDQVNTDSDLT